MITSFTHNCTDTYKAQLNDLMQEVFGFNFARWHQQKVWNSDYTCYSIIEGGRMLANACAYRMDMLVNGQQRKYLQLGAVATRSEARGKGLSRRIIEHILAQHPGTPAFLFANETVTGFYPRFGFRPITDHQPWLPLRLDGSAVMKRLDPDTDSATIGTYLTGRACFSHRLDCTNAAPIQWFHLLLSYPHAIYEIPALQTMLVAEQASRVLTIYDIAARRPMRWEELLPHLGFAGVEEVCFGFNPDWLGMGYQTREHDSGSTIFVRGEFAVEGAFIFPEMIST